MSPTTEAATPPAPPPPAPEKTKAISGQTDQVLSLLDVVVDEMDRKAITRQEIRRIEFNNDWRLAEVFAEAGYFESNGRDTPPMTKFQAMAKIEVGRSWDLNPADAVRFVYIIGGKPAIEEAVFASRLYQAGWSWEIQWLGGQGAGCRGCRLFAKKDGKPVMEPVRAEDGSQVMGGDGKPLMYHAFAEFTEPQAAQIKIWQKGNQVSILQKSGPWSDGRRANMYYWRAVSQFRRWFAPHVIAGALIRDEAQDIILEEMEIAPPKPEPAILKAANSALADTAPPRKAEKTADEKYNDTATHTPVAEQKTEKAAEPTKSPKPILPETVKSLRKMEAELTTAVFNETLQGMTFASIEDIKFEVDATAVLMKLLELKKAKGK